MMTNFDEAIVLEPQSPAKACVIWLHGLGADGNDFVPIIPQLNVQESLAIRFIFPHAKVQAVTINGGYQMRAWYDITQADLQRQPDLGGIADSVSYLHKLIDEQLESGIPLNKLVLAGFSQGGVVALDCALRMPEKPAGVMALSTYLAEPIGHAEGLSIFQGHGLQDTVVLPEAGKKAADHCRSVGASVEWHEYNMEHSVHPQEILDIAVWLKKVLS